MIDLEILNKLEIHYVNLCSIERMYYISNKMNIYLHKDRTIHDYCGRENFFDSYKEAEDFLNKVKEEYDFIKKEEFSV